MDKKTLKWVAIIAAGVTVAGLYLKDVFFFSLGAGALSFSGIASIVLWRNK